MAAKKGTKSAFSKVKAVKANARERVGQPKPVKPILEKKHAPRRKPATREILERENE